MLTQPDSLIPRSHDWLAGSGAAWNGERSEWSFPSGAVLRFGHVQHEKDVYNYQGGAYSFVGFDELTQFTEFQFSYLFSRLRRLEGSNVPTRMRAGSNPGGLGHDWVKRRFLVEGRAGGRVFLPARLVDNPYLDRADYERSLQELDPYTRAMLLRGDWDARKPGALFRRDWFEIVDQVPDVPSVSYWDLAATPEDAGTDPDWTAKVRAWADDGIVYLSPLRMRGTPGEVEKRVVQEAELDGKGVSVYLEQEPGASGKTVVDHYQRRVLFGWPVYGDLPSGPKEERWRPLSSLAEAGHVKLLRGQHIGAFLDEAESNPGGEHDDLLDAASGAVSKLSRSDVWKQSGYGPGDEEEIVEAELEKRREIEKKIREEVAAAERELIEAIEEGDD